MNLKRLYSTSKATDYIKNENNLDKPHPSIRPNKTRATQDAEFVTL